MNFAYSHTVARSVKSKYPPAAPPVQHHPGGLHIHPQSTKLKRTPPVATIDPSITSSDSVPPRASSGHNPPQSTSRPTSRRSNVNRQIFQFALGYPQTPPDTTPDIDPIGPLLNGGSSGAQSNMGTFVFRWYVKMMLLNIDPRKKHGLP